MQRVWLKTISPNKGRPSLMLVIPEMPARETIICISQLRRFLMRKTSGMARTLIPIHCCGSKDRKFELFMKSTCHKVREADDARGSVSDFCRQVGFDFRC